MPIPRPTRPAALAAALAACALAALAPAALAADAPTRTVAFDPAGQPITGLSAVAVSPDGTAVVFNRSDASYVRNVATGQTTLLRSDANVVAASDDLRWLVLKTDTSLDPRDSDQSEDLYLLDRLTSQTTFASPVTSTLAGGGQAYDVRFDAVHLSGDGNVLRFRAERVAFVPNTVPYVPPRYEYSSWAFARESGVLYPVAATEDDRIALEVARADRIGSVAITTGGAIIDGRKVNLPYLPGNATANARASRRVAVSANGSAIAVHATAGANANRLSIVRTSDGAVTTVPVPSWLVTSGYTLHGVGDGGTGVVITTTVQRPAGQRQVVGWLTRTGAVTQTGGDVPSTGDVGGLAVSANAGFAANGLVIAQLGSWPLPGGSGTPQPVPPPTFSRFMTFTDVSCRQIPWSGVEWLRATASLSSSAVGLDPRTPVSAKVRVVNTATPATVYGDFTMTAGTTRQLYVPRTNGWTATATITFSDGTQVSGQYVASTGVPQCDPFYWF